MPEPSFNQLINNAALLLITAIIFDISKIRWRSNLMGIQRLLVGSVLGFICIMLMVRTWTFAPGIIFDTRSILLSISGLFFGFIPTIIAMIIAAIFRFYQGGAAAWAGISVIFATGTIGLIWGDLRKKQIEHISILELYLFGVVNHIVMLLLMLMLPHEVALQVLAAISLPVLLIYPIATTLLGMLLVDRAQRDKINQALKEREEQLSLAVQSANIGFFDRNLRSGETHISHEWKQQIGYEDDEISNDNMEWESRLHPDDKESTIAKMKACIESLNNFYELNFRLRHKNGSYRWLLSRGMILRNNSGKAIQLIGCQVDVTDQKEKEQAILIKERRFRGLAESTQDIIVLFDRNLQHEYVNPAGLSIFGSHEPDGNLRELQTAAIVDRIFVDMNDTLLQLFSKGEPSQKLVYLQEYEKKYVFDTRLSPVFNAEYQVEWVVGISRDVTMIFQAEAALRESEEKFRRIFHTSGIGIFISDLSGKFNDGNPALLDILGYNIDEYCKLRIADITHPGDLELILTMYNSFLLGERDSYSIENRYIRKDGEIVWGKLTTTLVKDEKNTPLFTIGMLEDITEKKLVEEKEKLTRLELKRLLINADQSRRALLSVIEDQKIAGDELKRLTNDLLVAYDSTLQGWSNALELRERETAGHSRRVVNLTLEIARTSGVEGEALTNIERGALLHDIGKMGIPDNILLKPGPLTNDEWIIMRKHPVYAYNLLSNIDYLKPALDIPYSHHEWWDGSGYPQGLAGTEIPLAARIFTVVDIWDALSSDRPYRPAWSKEKISNYIKNLAGTQLDPKIVDVFFKIIGKEGNELQHPAIFEN